MPTNPFEPPKEVAEGNGRREWNPRWIGYTLLMLTALWLLWILVEGMAIHPRFKRVDPNWPIWIPDPRSFLRLWT